MSPQRRWVYDIYTGVGGAQIYFGGKNEETRGKKGLIEIGVNWRKDEEIGGKQSGIELGGNWRQTRRD